MDGRIRKCRLPRGRNEATDVIAMRMRDENVGYACGTHTGSGHGLWQGTGHRPEVVARARIKKHHVLVRSRQQRLNAELEMIPRRARGLQNRSYLGDRLAQNETLAIIRFLYP